MYDVRFWPYSDFRGKADTTRLGSPASFYARKCMKYDQFICAVTCYVQSRKRSVRPKRANPGNFLLVERPLFYSS